MLSQLSNLLGFGLAMTAPETKPGQKPTTDFATLFAETEADERPQAGKGTDLPDVDDPDGVAVDAPEAEQGPDEIGDMSPARSADDPETPEIAGPVDVPDTGRLSSKAQDTNHPMSDTTAKEPVLGAGPDPLPGQATGKQWQNRVDAPLFAGTGGAAPHRIGGTPVDAHPSGPAGVSIAQPVLPLNRAATRTKPAQLSIDPGVGAGRNTPAVGAPDPLVSTPLGREAREPGPAPAGLTPPPEPGKTTQTPAPVASDTLGLGRTDMAGERAIRSPADGRAPEAPEIRTLPPVARPPAVSRPAKATGPEMPIFRLRIRELSAHETLPPTHSGAVQVRAGTRTPGAAAPTVIGPVEGLANRAPEARLPEGTQVPAHSMKRGDSIAPQRVPDVPVAPALSGPASPRNAGMTPGLDEASEMDSGERLRLLAQAPFRQTDIGPTERSERMLPNRITPDVPPTDVPVAHVEPDETPQRPLPELSSQGVAAPSGLLTPVVPKPPHVTGHKASEQVEPFEVRLSKPVPLDRTVELEAPPPKARPGPEHAPSVVHPTSPTRAADVLGHVRVIGTRSDAPPVEGDSDQYAVRAPGDGAATVTPVAAPAAPLASLGISPQQLRMEAARRDRAAPSERQVETAPDPSALTEAARTKPADAQALALPLQGVTPAFDRPAMSRVTSPLLADLLEDPKVTQGLTAEGLPELRAHATGTAVHTAAPMARPDPQPVLRQIADGVARMRDGGIELQLAPEELGRVRMQMVPGESGLAVHITADRPETLDLMRRNIEQLARDLADAGYGGAAFTFGDSGGGNEDRTPRGGSGALTREPAERAIPEPAETTPVTDGLDIRI